MERRNGSRLTFEPDRGVLVVGGRIALLDAAPPADVVVGTYVELVVAQRAVVPASRRDLRDRELLELAELLHMPAEDLDALIDRELTRLLKPAADDAPATEPRTTRRTLAFGALAIVAVAAALAAATTAGGADPKPQPEPQSQEPTVETVVLPDGSTATRTESAPVPPTEDGVDIGTAVQYER